MVMICNLHRYRCGMLAGALIYHKQFEVHPGSLLPCDSLAFDSKSIEGL